jgi:hypothetical protein
VEFDSRLATILESMADRMEGRTPTGDGELQDAFERLEQAVRVCCLEGSQESMAVEPRTLLALSRTAESLVLSLESEMFPSKFRCSVNL